MILKSDLDHDAFNMDLISSWHYTEGGSVHVKLSTGEEYDIPAEHARKFVAVMRRYYDVQDI